MQHWTDYWKNVSALNSFAAGDVAKGYTGEISDFWLEVLSQCSSAASVLDIGTGNGGLAHIAQQYSLSHNKLFNVLAIDAADIDPVKSFQNDSTVRSVLEKITFYPNCYVEQLPFPDSSIDLVISQFALEYSDLNSALNQCARVLKPAGRLVAIMHHSSSALVKDSSEGLKMFRYALESSEFVSIAFQLLEYVERLVSTQVDILKDQHYLRMNTVLLECVKKMVTEVGTDNAWLNDLLSRVVPYFRELRAGNLYKFQYTIKSMLAYKARLEDQLNAAMSFSELKVFADSLTAATCWKNAEVSEFKVSGNIFGLVLKTEK